MSDSDDTGNNGQIKTGGHPIKSIVAQLMGKEEHGPLAQFIKYGIAGGLATGVHIGIFYILAGFILHALSPDDPAVKFLGMPSADLDDSARANLTAANNFIAFLFSNLVAYIVNVKWVFEGGRHSKAVEVAMFYAVSGTSIAIGTGIAFVLVKYLGLTTTVAFGSNVIASVMINYVMRKFVIFKG